MFNQRDELLLTRYRNAMSDIHADLVSGRISPMEAAQVNQQVQMAMAPLMQRKQAAEMEVKQKAQSEMMQQNAFLQHMRQTDQEFAAKNLQSRIAVVKDPRTGEDHHVYVDSKGDVQSAPWQDARYETQGQQREAAADAHAQERDHAVESAREVDPAGVNLFGMGLLAGATPNAEPAAPAPGVRPAAYGSVNWSRHDAQQYVHQEIQRRLAEEKAKTPKITDLFPEVSPEVLKRVPPPPQVIQQRLDAWKRSNPPPPPRPEWMNTEAGRQARVDSVFANTVKAVKEAQAQAGADPVQQAKEKAAADKALRDEEKQARTADKEELDRRSKLHDAFVKFAEKNFTTKKKEGDVEKKTTDWTAAAKAFHDQRSAIVPHEYESVPEGADAATQVPRLKPYQSQLDALMAKRKAAEDAKPAPNTGYRPYSPEEMDRQEQTQQDARMEAAQRNFIESQLPEGWTMKDYDEAVGMLNGLGKKFQAWRGAQQQAAQQEAQQAPDEKPYFQGEEEGGFGGSTKTAADIPQDTAQTLAGFRPIPRPPTDMQKRTEQAIQFQRLRNRGMGTQAAYAAVYGEDRPQAPQQPAPQVAPSPPVDPSTLTGMSDNVALDALKTRPARGTANVADYSRGPGGYPETKVKDDTEGSIQWLKDNGYWNQEE